MPRVFWRLWLLLLHCNICFAQDNYSRNNYDWEANRKISFQPGDSELKMPAIIVLDERYFDYINSENFDHQQIGPHYVLHSKKYELYYTRHKIVRVNDDRGIDKFNKISIPLNAGDEIIKLKARTINPDGNIIELANEKFLDISNYEIYGNFKVFALEGVQKGCELEYIYTVCRKRPTYSGVETMQSIFPVKKEKIIITSPYTLVFTTKSYNNFPEATIEKNNNTDQIVIKDSAQNIPPVEEEAFAPANANIMKLGFRLVDEEAENEGIASTWNKIGRAFYDGMARNIDEVNLSVVSKKLNLNSVARDEQIRRIEEYMKRSIVVIPMDTTGSTFYFDPQNVLDEKIGNSFGAIRLYMAFFRKWGIPFKLVCTSDRKEGRFDAENIIPEDFGEMLFYFPIGQKYLSPFSKVNPYGYAPAKVAFNNGLFMDGFEGKIDRINGMKMDNTYEMVKAEVSIDTNMDTVEVKEQSDFSGYQALDILGNHEFSDSTGKDKILESFKQRRGISDAKILNQEINVQPMDNTGVKKLSVVTNYQSNSLIEKAGKDYLLNAGLLIHKQPRINKEEKNRLSDIELPYPIQYLNHIRIKIPAGYKVKGLDEFKMNKAVTDSNNLKTCQFSSSYSFNGNDLDLNISETFSKADYDKKDYEAFRQVINAAADFNKLQLVLEKE